MSAVVLPRSQQERMLSTSQTAAESLPLIHCLLSSTSANGIPEQPGTIYEIPA